MNNIEEKAVIDISNSYETISLEPNGDEKANTAVTGGGDKDLTYSELPLSSESSSPNEGSSSKIERMYQALLQKAIQVIDMVAIEKSYKMFFAVLTLGIILLLLSLLMLPMFMLTPVKFIFTFGTGNIITVFSFVFLYGLKDYCEMLFTQNRKWLSLSFFLSILLGLIFAWKGHFFLSLIFAVYQIITVIMFTLSFVPGGQNGIVYIKDLLKTPFVGVYESIKAKFG